MRNSYLQYSNHSPCRRPFRQKDNRGTTAYIWSSANRVLTPKHNDLPMVTQDIIDFKRQQIHTHKKQTRNQDIRAILQPEFKVKYIGINLERTVDKPIKMPQT